ncbi:MAG: alanine/glycine:cation symporter family protein [Parachlamydiaceae bacterium]
MDIQFFMEEFTKVITLYLAFPAVFVLGIYFTVKLRCIQLSKLKLSLHYLLKKGEHSEQGISQYQALSAVLAGNFGAGNIPGMAMALTAGGPGALVWMWVMAFFGASIQYASCLLGGKFSKRDEANRAQEGGPMYYLAEGLGFKVLALLFSLFTIAAAISVGNFVQINSILLPLNEMGISSYIPVIIFGILASIVILGGVHRFANVVSSIVPMMAIMYIGTTILILFYHAELIWPAIKLMFQSAFDFQAFFGGALGAGSANAMTAGFDRGLFATDAGSGLVPILQSNAKAKNPVINGVVTLVAPFLVMVVCTGTGLVLMVTGAWMEGGLLSTNMVTWAFSKGLNHGIGAYIVLTALVMFAYTTTLAWANCAERAVSYIWGCQKAYLFRYLYIGIMPFAIFVPCEVSWLVSDFFICLMLCTNMIGVACLSKHVISDSQQFFHPEPIKYKSVEIF